MGESPPFSGRFLLTTEGGHEDGDRQRHFIRFADNIIMLEIDIMLKYGYTSRYEQ